MKHEIPDLADIRGNEAAVLEASEAACHRRNMLLLGPPSIGATMLARRLGGLLGPCSEELRTHLTATYQRSRLLNEGERVGGGVPFRAPHHSISDAALAGTAWRAGEAQLAAGGILYLDDLPEFRRSSMEALAATLAAAPRALRPTVVASAAPCPCGWRGVEGVPGRACHCVPGSVARYRDRLERLLALLGIETVVRLEVVTLDQCRSEVHGRSTAELRRRFAGATQ